MSHSGEFSWKYEFIIFNVNKVSPNSEATQKNRPLLTKSLCKSTLFSTLHLHLLLYSDEDSPVYTTIERGGKAAWRHKAKSLYVIVCRTKKCIQKKVWKLSQRSKNAAYGQQSAVSYVYDILPKTVDRVKKGQNC